MDNEKPRWIFILSTPRSGSTLLSVLLGAHSSVVAPPELHAFRFPDYASWKRGYSLSMKSLGALMNGLGYGHSEQELERRFSGMDIDGLYECLLDLAGPGRLLVDKTPSYGCLDDSLAHIEGLKPYYIWLLRHPLGVASSRHERKWSQLRRARDSLGWYRYRYQWLRRKVLDASGIALKNELNYWVDVHQRIGRFLGSVEAGRFSIVQFESLVRNPQAVMQGLCDELGLALEPGMLDPAQNIPGEMQWGIGDEKIHSHPRITPAVADSWKERYDVSKLDAGILRLMEKLGVEA